MTSQPEAARLPDMTSKARRVTLLLTGLLLVGGVVGLIAFAVMPKHRLIPINDLARLVKDGQIASVEVSGNDGTEFNVLQLLVQGRGNVVPNHLLVQTGAELAGDEQVRHGVACPGRST